MVTITSVISQDAMRIAARSQNGVDQTRIDSSAQRQQVLQNATAAPPQEPAGPSRDQPAADPSNDSVRVSSTIGKAASSGMLSRDEAVAIYQKIANML